MLVAVATGTVAVGGTAVSVAVGTNVGVALGGSVAVAVAVGTAVAVGVCGGPTTTDPFTLAACAIRKPFRSRSNKLRAVNGYESNGAFAAMLTVHENNTNPSGNA